MSATAADPCAGDVDQPGQPRVSEMLVEGGAPLGLDREPRGLRECPGHVRVERGLARLDFYECLLSVVALEQPGPTPLAVAPALGTTGRVVRRRRLDEGPPA